jgi:transcriptional regulator with XRE-family HTH domain
VNETSAAVRRRFTENLIALLERGLRSPRLDTIVKLAGALEVEPCELLRGMAWRLTQQQGAYVHVGSTGSLGGG